MSSIEIIDIGSSEGEDDNEDDCKSNVVDKKFNNLSALAAAAAATSERNGNDQSGVEGDEEGEEEDEDEEDCSDNSKSITIPAPIQILENQRRSIDQLFETYADCHNRLLRLTPFMNPLQRRRWQKHMSGKQVPIVIGGPEENADEQREFNFEDEEDAHFARLWDRRQRQAPEPSGYVRRARAAPKRRKKVKRKAPRRVYAKREPTAGASSSSRSNYSSAAGPSSRPSASSSSADRKPSKSSLASSLARFSVKKER